MAVKLPKKAKKKTGKASFVLPKKIEAKTSDFDSLEDLRKNTASTGGREIRLKDRDAITIRFLQEPMRKGKVAGWKQFWEHYVRGENGGFVPCFQGCPLDEDVDSRPTKRYLSNVMDISSGEVRLLKMTKSMADSLALKFERSSKDEDKRTLTARNYTVIRIGDGTDTKYEFENEDKGALEIDGKKVDLKKIKLIDLDEEIANRIKHFWGADDSKHIKPREDDDEDEEDEDVEDEAEDDEEDESDEEEDEEDEEDDEEDDEVEEDEVEEDEEEEEEDEEEEDEEDDEEEEEVVKKARAKKPLPKSIAKKGSAKKGKKK